MTAGVSGAQLWAAPASLSLCSLWPASQEVTERSPCSGCVQTGKGFWKFGEAVWNPLAWVGPDSEVVS